VDAADENKARAKGREALDDLCADVRELLDRAVPLAIRTVRPATDDEVRFWNWHRDMLGPETARPKP